MISAEQNFLANIKTLHRLKIPRTCTVAATLLAVLIILTIVVLSFTPWIQTAQGMGEVSTLDAEDRIQEISALVTGQIQHWHVREGQKVKKGDSIVTLVDNDKELVERLKNQLAATEQRHKANLSAVVQGESNLNRQKDLLKKGLVSERNVESVQISLEDLRAKAASTAAEVSEIRVNLARQSIQTKLVPQDGTILRLSSAGSATYVKPGDVLAWFIPDGVERSVTLKVSGLDAPLVKPGRKVRLRFEGWPVLQFSGWPEVAIGTFGGIVQFVEPVADDNGRFTVWVKPDENEHPWPSENFARLGSRVQGWVLLEEVKLGYEMWRQFNNFPPEQSPGNENAIKKL